jgi:hypothetical protein
MGFASTYLKNRALFPVFIKEAPSEDTEIIVVIPSYDEPDITGLLDSLVLCEKTTCGVEVILIVNAPAGAGRESLLNNRRSVYSARKWKREHPECFFRLFVIDVTDDEPEGWGVGMARKTGMDEAVRRFELLNNPGGIILNLDADCKVKGNYFSAVYKEMHGRKEKSACSIYFEHPLSGSEFPPEIYRSIILYELHLRYYFQGVAYTGFPYVHHTVGSAIAVKALPYVKAGGMNRRMAGEDFYFIQKLLPAGGYFNLNTTAVFPSPRSSSRVPFGTGITVSKLTGSDNELFPTYNFEAFRELKALFSLIDKVYLTGTDDPDFSWSDLPPGVKQFTGIEEWRDKIREIKNNTSGIDTFRKRFFGWFNMFRIVKYLNSTHNNYFKKRPVTECALELLRAAGKDLTPEDPATLLLYFRSLELEG